MQGTEWEHLILPASKISRTPKSYPRKAGTPKDKPIGEKESSRKEEPV